jgi:hypothetical protein
MVNILDAAVEYEERYNWASVPLHHIPTGGGCSCGRPDCRSMGKHPRTLHGALDASTDPAVIRQWWRRWPRANVGIATGALSGFDALDVDPRHGGDETLLALTARYGGLPRTVESITGGGGRHLLFRHSDALRTGLGPGLDIRTTGHLIVAPPSIHASGRRYEWDVTAHPADVAIPPWPEWMLDRVSADRLPRQAAARRGAKSGRPIPVARWQRVLTGCKRLRELEAVQRDRGVSYDEWLAAVAVARLGGSDGHAWAIEFTEMYAPGSNSDDLVRLAGWLSGNLTGTATCTRLGCHPGLCGFRPRVDAEGQEHAPSPLRHAWARALIVEVA